MIVTCTSCGARFRVADERVGPRGARVRCSKCQTVFAVQPEGGAPPPDPRPALPVDLESGARALGAAAARGPAAHGDDPFAGARGSPVAPASQPEDDPFAAPARAAANANPLGEAPSHAAASDPFAEAGAPDAGGSSSFAARTHPPLTDLSDLGAPAPPRARGLAVPPPLPGMAPAAPAGSLGSEDLALEERTPGAIPRPAPFDDAFDPGALAGDFASSELEVDFGAGAAAGAPPAAEPLAPAPTPVAKAGATPRTAAPPPRPAQPEPASAEAALAARKTRLRALAVNSVSLAAVVGLAIAMFAVYRGEREGRLLGPGELLRGGGSGAGAAVTAAQVTSGLYETASGGLVLFVRGAVRVRAQAPVGPVKVRAELVQRDRVLATAEGLAGAVPSPEEVAGLRGGEDAERLRAQLESRAPQVAQPGEALPFLVLFPEVPADLDEVSLRVSAEAAPAPGRG